MDIIFRSVILVVLVLMFTISTSYRKRAREEGDLIERREEGIAVMVIRLFFGLLFLAVHLLNIFYPRLLSWDKFELPIYLRFLGTAIAIICVPLIWWVFKNTGKNVSETMLIKVDHELVTSGPYQWVRHPLYGTALLLLFSISITFGDWILLVGSLIGLIAFRLLVIPAEEKQLLDAFGEEYECYQARTGALLPWIR
ncbi:MAG: isoprenylcysteine carboxylmethyltransferase family protein [Anaerolineales bacterium]|nr:isoprenylcysteine carboxylmethyltransferase family protein [Anaerolineales bacterium]